MQASQQLNNSKIVCTASLRRRIAAGCVFLAVFGLFGLFRFAAKGKIDLERWFTPCGFKQRYGLPCPTCGITTSVQAFSEGKILESFYIQPAGGLLCCVLVVLAFFAFLIAVFGVYFGFLERFFHEIKIKYIILAFLIIIVLSWAVTLARALAANNQG